MEDFSCQVTAEKAPGRTVGGGADVVLVAGDDFAGGERFGSV